jgi:hypothetical protein
VESDLPKGYRGAAERSSNVGVPAFPLERTDAESGCPGVGVPLINKRATSCRTRVLSPEFRACGCPGVVPAKFPSFPTGVRRSSNVGVQKRPKWVSRIGSMWVSPSG